MFGDKFGTIDMIMDSMDYGIFYIDTEGMIRSCNRKAKEITGIEFKTDSSHQSGHLSEGDIVIIADNAIGADDGNLTADDLVSINIRDRDIGAGDMLVAVGVYKNQKIEPQYKSVKEHQINVPLRLSTNYFGFSITARIDITSSETEIVVNGKKYVLPFFSAVGNIVVIDGKTGQVKFFQEKGYSVRHETICDLLRGKSYLEKTCNQDAIDVVGEKFMKFFEQSTLTDKLAHILDGRPEKIKNEVYEINKRPVFCNALADEDESGRVRGVFLAIQEADDLEALFNSRNDIIKQMEVNKNLKDGRKTQIPADTFKNFTGESSEANEVKYMACKAAKNKFNVIITGESGTGKSVIAREIHRIGTPKAPFVEVNCNAIAPSLFESELFGYVGGAFTGAKSDGKTGFFEAANGGTIFLDEIGEIPLDIQVKLLYVLQDKIIYRVGSSKPVKVDVRVIAATNKNLETEVAEGRFRQDLFYRINVFPIRIPPLRERKKDLYLLINQILTRTCNTYEIDEKQFSGEAIQKMLSYSWPGNVRELENVIERAVTLCDSSIIYDEHLSIGRGETTASLKDRMAIEERRIIEQTLSKNNWDKVKTMDELDLSRSVFYDKLKKYNINTKPKPSDHDK